MTYNQVQYFQINDLANHYVDIEITGYRVLYSQLLLLFIYRVLFSESIAGRGVARLISWLGTAELVDCFNRVFDCYNIRLYIQSFNNSIFIGRVQATFGLVSHIARPIFCGGGEIPISTVQLFPRCV